MPLSPRRADPGSPFIHRTAGHDVVMGPHKGRLFVRQWLPKSGTGPILIAIHGLTGSGMDFEFMAQRLAGVGWQVICPDLPGHGRSTHFKNSEAYATGHMSRALATLSGIYARGSEPVSVLGASWGGAAILLFLAAYRLRVRALIVNDIAFEYDPYLDRYTRFLRKEWDRRFSSLEEARRQLMARNHVLFRQRDNDRIDPNVMRRHLNAHIGRTFAGKYRFNYDRAFMRRGRIVPGSYPDYRTVMASLRADRIMLMFGEHSPFRDSATVQSLRRDDRRVEYVEIPGAGHAPRLMTEGEVAIVREFLERRAAR